MIVADASPLIVLAKLQHLELLNDLYGEVLMGSVVKAGNNRCWQSCSCPGGGAA